MDPNKQSNMMGTIPRKKNKGPPAGAPSSLSGPIPRRPSMETPIPRRPSVENPVPRRKSNDHVSGHRPPSNHNRNRDPHSRDPHNRDYHHHPPSHHEHHRDFHHHQQQHHRRPSNQSKEQQYRQRPHGVERRTSTSSAAFEEERRKPPKRIRLKSEDPMILVIRTTGMSLKEGIPKQTDSSTERAELGQLNESRPSARHETSGGKDDARAGRSASSRTASQKRPRSVYLEDTDSEEEAAMTANHPAKKAKVAATEESKMEVEVPTANALTATFPVDSMHDGPPPGTLSTLWYSNESFLHLWVLDKVCGFKMRKTTTLQNVEPTVLWSHTEALELQSKVLQANSIWTDPNRRMDVSRINPTHCPVLQAAKSAMDPSTWKYEIAEEKEEVLLIKWRGRSHLHCSWERAADVIRLDGSNNSTARNKIRRYYQQQEMTIGLNWKNMLTNATANDGGDMEPADEYFAGDCMEIERILACDENELNMDVLTKQRRINLAEADTPADSSKAQETPSSNHALSYQDMIKDVDLKAEKPWDPEDNVRYVVKWKGLPFAEMTWEYWRDIKREAVEEAEAFWYRQKAPTEYKQLPHPHMRDFRKLQSSPTYGLSRRKRPWDPPLLGDEDEDTSSKGFRLRGYQLEGVNWLLFNWWNNRSCILADEMGLGKTIQSTAFLRELQEQPAAQVRAPFLIVAPLSLVGQWQSELLSWAPDMNVLLYHGSADAREFLVQQEFYYTDQFIPKQEAARLKKNHVTKFHVLITTYEVVLKDASVMSRIKWKALIVDEAHRLKNSKSRLFEQLANVPRDFCLLLTGTPIANATEELWALLHFANPKDFVDKDSFLEKFGEMTDAQQVNELHSLLKPFLLRRVKEDVEKSLPPKEETILEVSLTPIQKTYYKAIYERNTSFLFKGSKSSNAPSLMNVMMELRKCCNHPYLVQGAEERILADAAEKLKGKADDEGKPVPVDYVKLFGEQLIKSSGKMVLMEKLLQKLFTGGHKVLVFSQMVKVLDLLEELLKLKSYRYERLDGSTSSSLRAHAVERFNKKSYQRFVMLLSTRAGGLGLNLTAADIVIIFDSDWNPQNDLQAMARAHRIGQTRAVRVYRLLTAKTYEMHMFHSASLKLGLERAVMSQNREQNDDGDEKSKKRSDKEAQAKQIDELLKKGAYDVFREEDDKEAEKFMETDIDQLLEHSSKKVTYGASATSSLGSGLGSFSKASFVANTDDGTKDVDLDDPDFWSKAVGFEAQEEMPEDVAQMLDDGVKRNRKQVQVYDPYAETAEAEQRKKDKIALEKLMEKEEKERVRMEKKAKKKDAKDKKKRDKEKLKMQLSAEKQKAMQPKVAESLKKVLKNAKEPKEPKVKEVKPKKSKKDQRLRALRRAENADPMLERLKQAWEAPQRNRVVAAFMRFGFSRFCKIRNESNLASLPLQDVEIFLRAYIYQLGLQVIVTLSLYEKSSPASDLRKILREWLGASSSKEIEWICSSVRTAMQLQLDVQAMKRELRMPVILAEPSFVDELRNGAALRSLRRVGLLSRLNRFVDECLESILSVIGNEALGKRSCTSSDLSNLDPDLKARFVTTEELSLAIASFYQTVGHRAPAAWWDRSCDIGLIVGSFVHGLGNYEAMRQDVDLPFAERIAKVEQTDPASMQALITFNATAAAARRVFDDALDACRVKAELEAQAAVAKAAKDASKREEDAALLRKGGAEAEAVISEMPETQVQDAFAFDGTDSHYVTLARLMKCVKRAAVTGLRTPVIVSRGDGKGENGASTEDNHQPPKDEPLPMPDARVLDFRVRCILDALEESAYPDEQSSIKDQEGTEASALWRKSPVISKIMQVQKRLVGELSYELSETGPEFTGIGIGINQCGVSHRTLNDGSDFGYGSASVQLSQLAYGTDAPRYLRALGVPMNMTRFAICGLVHARETCTKEVLRRESLRFYGIEDADGVSRGSMEEVTRRSSTASSFNPSAGVDPNSTMDQMFLESPELRATICIAVLFYGFPAATSGSTGVQSSLLDDLDIDQEWDDLELFSQQRFRDCVSAVAPEVQVPDADVLATYIEKFLLPHCLQLCINGNGPVLNKARGSHGDYTTPLGVNIHPEPSKPYPCPIPDPCVSLQEHSLEALGYANAILRRVQMLRASIYIASDASCSGIVPGATRSEAMGCLEGMPIWWCPWVHDVALLVQAATSGLFSVLQNRDQHPVWSPDRLEGSLRTAFLGTDIYRRTDMELASLWAQSHTRRFPSLYQVERRLGILCSLATAVDAPDEVRYDHVPMFDHGAWPR